MFICTICKDYGKSTERATPKDLALHIEKHHKREVGQFLERHKEETNGNSGEPRDEENSPKLEG